MADLREIITAVLDPEAQLPSAQEILDVLGKHPYFAALAFQWLKRAATLTPPPDEELKRRIALYAALAAPGDGTSLQYRLLDLVGGHPSLEPFYPPEPEQETPSTFDAIDRFMESYAGDTDVEQERRVIENLIFNPTVDYAAMLEAEESKSLPEENNTPPNSQDDLINSFILKQKKHDDNTEAAKKFDPAAPLVRPPVVPDARPVTPPPPIGEETLLSESLARIYIKRKNYKAAREIINKLNLNYPEKSVYFAVQLRFLDKLILNQQLMEAQEAKNRK